MSDSDNQPKHYGLDLEAGIFVISFNPAPQKPQETTAEHKESE